MKKKSEFEAPYIGIEYIFRSIPVHFSVAYKA